jgi:hypothetical protein
VPKDAQWLNLADLEFRWQIGSLYGWETEAGTVGELVEKESYVSNRPLEVFRMWSLSLADAREKLHKMYSEPSMESNDVKTVNDNDDEIDDDNDDIE